MSTIDDPMLALILRFVGRNQGIEYCHDEFLREETKAIREYVAGFPPEERQLRSLEWVEKYAREYREDKMKEIVGEMFSSQRCPDCPLSELGDSENCKIHEEWLALLQQYAADEINTRAYVERSLELLVQHKEDLKLSLKLSQKGESVRSTPPLSSSALTPGSRGRPPAPRREPDATPRRSAGGRSSDTRAPGAPAGTGP